MRRACERGMVLISLLRNAQWQFLLLAARRDSCQLGRDVEVRPSPNKGVGVFALRDLAEGAVLDRYTGRYMDLAEYDQRVEDGRTGGRKGGGCRTFFVERFCAFPFSGALLPVFVRRGRGFGGRFGPGLLPVFVRRGRGFGG